MIPREVWKYRGLKGHHILRSRCRFRICTDIGQFRVSTVGAYYQFPEDEFMKMVGFNRHYETFVFRIEDDEIYNGFEIDSDYVFFDKEKDDPYEKDEEAEAMHDKMCEKYAEIGFKDWMEKQ